jgi:peptide/nickel transport system ATP-binding protein/oligopeptide transport system ATP-binding protein
VSEALYVIDNLVVDLYAPTVSIRAVDGVSFRAEAGETVAIVGESGSGKTVMTLAPLGLLPEGVRTDLRGSARVGTQELIGMDARALSRLRGGTFGVVFQDPMSALNPMLKVGPQLAEQARRNRGLTANESRKAAISLLARTGIPDPEDRYNRYPHEMSGGMLQRVMIGLALAAQPKVLIADEPTTALDATVQAQILELLRDIQRRERITVILITHDIGAVAAAADRVIVLYAGRVCEEGPVGLVLTDPVHPYTRGLLASVPDFRAERARATVEIPGLPPDQSRLESGCRFAARCPKAEDACRGRRPDLVAMRDGRKVACPVSLRERAAAHV